MSEATFYTHVVGLQSFVARLCRRALSADSRVLIWTDSESEALEWDRVLWQIPPESFLPHETVSDGRLPDDVPVLIGSGSLPESSGGRAVLNLSRQIWHGAGETVRVLEIIGSGEDELAAARNRFAAYRRQGFTLTHHNMHNKG
ncbi:DNA polymerase III subunit chi [Neisseria leonii]|uniref:DNA polymerase III subunit chi n=1 Tax=Neisseria leonii TaxID=2995413 RepID=A0A9X4E3D2_9NEIS|nr:DNA polymerase III subunit chi [Neisseria sp. 51.81]MDD9327211.1 DNA polymerase III subunit chi [Neisseria sp. 51.81]